MGLRWRLISDSGNDEDADDHQWHDYREIVAIVPVRSFDPRVDWQTQNFCDKPATKLCNAWLAGVPAILGGDSVYWAERQSSLDYLEVHSLWQVLEQLTCLRDNGGLRQAMVFHGYQSALAHTPQAITQRWLSFLNRVAYPPMSTGVSSRICHKRLVCCDLKPLHSQPVCNGKQKNYCFGVCKF